MKTRLLLILLALTSIAHAQRQNIEVGASPNDGTGDSLRAAGIKINANFVELYGGGYVYAMPALEMNMVANNTKTLSANATITFGTAPTKVLQPSSLTVTNTNASPITITLPANVVNAFSGATETNYTVPGAGANNGRRTVMFRWLSGTTYEIFTGSGGVAALTPWTGDIDGGGYDLSNVGEISANEFFGSGAGLTFLPAASISGTLPDLTTGTLTTTEARVVTPTPGVSNVVVTTNGETTIQLDATTETLTYSTTPPTGTLTTYTLLGHSADCTVSIPSTYSAALMSSRTQFVVPADKKVTIALRRDASEYVMWGDPIRIEDLNEETAPATSAQVEVSVSGVSKRATIANVKKAMRVGTKVYGSIASGATGDVTLDWESTDTIVYNVGGNATHTLPLASSLGGPAGLMYQFNVSGTITLDPNAADYIRFNATTQADGVTITITGTAGQTAFIWTDGANNWSTSGGTATFAAGS